MIEGEDEEAIGGKVELREMLELQLSEVEMLQSMFPSPGEFQLDDDSEISEIQAFVDDKIKYEYLQCRVGLVVKIHTDGDKSGVEMVCRLPHEYPALAPEIFVRAPSMTRDQHRRLGEDLQEFVLTLERGNICLGPIIEWAQENVENYMTEEPEEIGKKGLEPEFDNIFTRLWIFSHHIYSRFKRRDILAWASELKLTGFSLPGKPGMICAEGYSQAVDDYWQRLRRLNWKRLVIKEKEDFEIPENSDIDTVRTFKTFDEIAFDVRGGKGREYHMDLGQLYTFLEEHKLGRIFTLYFGVEGKTSTSDAT